MTENPTKTAKRKSAEQQKNSDQLSGHFLDKLHSPNKPLFLINAINRILSQSLQQPISGSEVSSAYSILPLLVKNSLNLLAKEIHLPFLLLSIQNDYSDEAIIVESSISNSETDEAGQKTRNVSFRHSYRLGEGIIGMVVESGKAYFCPDIHKAPEFLNRTGLKEQFSTAAVGFLCLPIMQNTTQNISIGHLAGAASGQIADVSVSPGSEQVIGTLSTGIYYRQSPSTAQVAQDYRLGSPVFETVEQLGAFLEIVCGLMANTVKMRIELEHEHQCLQRANAILRSRSSQNEFLQQIVGRSSAMQDLFLQITQVAKVNTTVLVRGESGTGKELVAKAIHQGSTRAKKPFVSVNCAALPEGVIDSELFGHVKGAFTGALQNHKGRFELAEGGTLFLDEISELPLHLQSKLLRVLQEKEYQALGSELPRQADVRIIAASNHNLEQDIRERNFREDLYFRLSVFPIHLPPLRERKSDITLLVDHFLEKNLIRLGTNVVRVADSAINLLMSYNWPGNVRELENVIERASILCEDGVIYAHHLPPTLQSGESSRSSLTYTLQEAVERLELDMLSDALKDKKGNMRLAAKQLGITERQIGLRMARYDLDYREFRH